MKKFLIVFGFMFFMNSTSAEAECMELKGKVYCSPPGGSILKSGTFFYPLCARGDCVHHKGYFYCSGKQMGAAVWIPGWVRPKCQGGCVAPSRGLCENLSGY